MYAPPLRTSFLTGTRQPCAVPQENGLVFDRSEYPVRQSARVAPRASLVARRFHDAPPFGRRRPDFVKEKQEAVRRLEEDRIPGRVTLAIRLDASGDFDRR